VQEYLDAGVQVVWLVDPPSRTIHLYEQGGKVALLQADAELTGEPVLPGFRCRVADLFAVLDDEQDAGPSGA